MKYLLTVGMFFNSLYIIHKGCLQKMVISVSGLIFRRLEALDQENLEG